MFGFRIDWQSGCHNTSTGFIVKFELGIDWKIEIVLFDFIPDDISRIGMTRRLQRDFPLCLINRWSEWIRPLHAHQLRALIKKPMNFFRLSEVAWSINFPACFFRGKFRCLHFPFPGRLCFRLGGWHVRTKADTSSPINHIINAGGVMHSGDFSSSLWKVSLWSLYNGCFDFTNKKLRVVKERRSFIDTSVICCNWVGKH